MKNKFKNTKTIILVFLTFSFISSILFGFHGLPRKRALVFFTAMVEKTIPMWDLIDLLIDSEAIKGSRLFSFFRFYVALNLFLISQEPILKSTIVGEGALLEISFSLVWQFDDFESENLVKKIEERKIAKSITENQYKGIKSFIEAFEFLNKQKLK